MVRKLYGDTVIDVDNMFNVVVCNYHVQSTVIRSMRIAMTTLVVTQSTGQQR